MALNLETWNGATWDTVDIEAESLYDFKQFIGYGGPARLEFKQHDEHQLTPIEPFTFIRFYNDAGDLPDVGGQFSASAPNFIGTVEEVNPGDDAHMIEYVCLDSTVRASNEINVMSAAWTGASTPATTAVPRLIVNAHIDADDDWSFSRNDPFTDPLSIGDIIEVILDDALLPLRDIFAAPSASDPYVTADLTDMDFEPQEKVVFTSEPVTAAVQRLIEEWEPEHRLLFEPTTLKWRFPNLTSATQINLTLNDFTETHPVLSLRLDRSVDERYGAVEFFGPEAVENRTVSVSGAGLTETVITGSSTLTLACEWQIADSTKRRVGRLLPEPFFAQVEVQFGALGVAFWHFGTWTQSPVLQAKFTNSDDGTDAWITYNGWRLEPQVGIISYVNPVNGSKGQAPVRSRLNPASPPYEAPSDVRFIYPNFIAPLTKRVPASGFEGTANSLYGLQSVMRIYDESLAVGWLLNRPVTSSSRLAKFEVLARKILDASKDVLYVGGVTLDGFDYRFHSLNRRVNFPAVDGDGMAKTSGWEAINAWVTDVEYDYTDQTTTLSFNSDQAELIAMDLDQVRELLRLDAQEIRFRIFTSVEFGAERVFTKLGTPVLVGQAIASSTTVPVVFDPFTGIDETPIFGT
ncbi:hypothetical protein KAR91_20100 [Candidatus Pacearchaeota archaeon]|nr:hypothetical protein [Candidatus Pacearchaeota archaeon]